MVEGASRRRPCRIGLTGGLASGKSTVAEVLRARGVPVLDADAVVHELYRPGSDLVADLEKRFGPAILAADGGIDRRALAGVILDDPRSIQDLNAIVHPRVRAEIRRWVDGQTAPIAVVEATLLVETGSALGYDLVLVVACRPEQQLERAVARGVSELRARALLGAQMPLEEKAASADVVIDNSGPMDDLEAAVDEAWTQVVRRCERRG